MNRIMCSIVCLLGLLPAILRADPVAVSVDFDTTYQTIDGFGAYGAKCPFWSACSEFSTPEFVDLVVNELGVSMLRMEISHDFEPVNDNDDPARADLSAFRSRTSAVGFGDQVVAYLRAVNEAMSRNGDTLKVICTIWSPPHWMKVNNDCCGTDNATNVLKDGMEEELAEFMAVFCRVFRERVGIDLYGISMQNEPEFAQPFGSCYYSPTRYLEVFRIVGRRFEQDGINTRLFGPEHVKTFQRMARYAGPIVNDPEAKGYLDVLATHGYELDGVTPGSPSVQDWQRSTSLAQAFKGVLWQTETGGGPTWPEAFELGQRIHQALRYGRISAWMHWSLSSRESTQPNQHHLINNLDRVSTVLHQGYVTAAFARHIRPGAVQVGSSSGNDSLVQIVAFVHPADRTLSVVLLNQSEATQSAALSGDGIPATFERFLTSESEANSRQGTVSASSVPLPARSITTLVADDFGAPIGLGSMRRPVPGRRGVVRPGGGSRVYGLDGTVLPGRSAGGPARVVVVSQETKGRTANLSVQGVR
ncbi:MAG: hypothetical protein GF331_16045 [Chitinivibrionales bacterium]|nr:hypothetical protein [Chitinivibrionales bacterium]